MNSVDRNISEIFHSSSRCDGLFFDRSLALGKSVIGTDGTELTFVSDGETVEVPAGKFDGCQLWVTKYTGSYTGHATVRNYYKCGVGIVRHERFVDGIGDVRVLKAYRIAGGDGLLPLASGNTWEYADTYNHKVMISSLKFTVAYSDEEKAIVVSENLIERLKYDDNSWLDMIEMIRNEYWKEEEKGREKSATYPMPRCVPRRLRKRLWKKRTPKPPYPLSAESWRRIPHSTLPIPRQAIGISLKNYR